MISKLICLEGPNAIGKTTVLKKLEQCLCSEGIKTSTFKDSTYPEMMDARKKIREGIITAPLEMTKTIARARNLVYLTYIKPDITAEIVLLDRWYYTSAVLQSGSQLSMARVIEENLRLGTPIPDRTFVLITSLSTLLKRNSERAVIEINRGYNPQFLAEQLNGYQKLLRDHLECVSLDNSGSINLTVNKIMEMLR